MNEILLKNITGTFSSRRISSEFLWYQYTNTYVVQFYFLNVLGENNQKSIVVDFCSRFMNIQQ